MNTLHALARTSERLIAAGLDPVKVAAKCDALARATAPHWNSVAVLITTLGNQYGDTEADIMSRESNGEEVWCVIREGRVVTVMFRRSSQPKRPDCFGVEKVLQVKP